jgi:folate-dependent phosphoribosylglycinamide formyltransferase PurN
MVNSLIFDLNVGRKMRVACFVSGSGTNAIKIIERSKRSDSNYEVVLLFSDVKNERLKKNGEKMCKAFDIAKRYSIPYESEDIRDFYIKKGHKNRRDLSIRPEYDEKILAKTLSYDLDIIANAGYMSIMSKPILDYYDGKIVNVHPADLSIMENNERKYVGIHVVKDAILEGDKELRSSTHIVREKVDYGEILVISDPIEVKLPSGVTIEELGINKKLMRRIVSSHQNQLKEKGDWVIYPMTLQLISEGKFALDGKGGVFFKGEYVPHGLSVERA